MWRCLRIARHSLASALYRQRVRTASTATGAAPTGVPPGSFDTCMQAGDLLRASEWLHSTISSGRPVPPLRVSQKIVTAWSSCADPVQFTLLYARSILYGAPRTFHACGVHFLRTALAASQPLAVPQSVRVQVVALGFLHRHGLLEHLTPSLTRHHWNTVTLAPLHPFPAQALAHGLMLFPNHPYLTEVLARVQRRNPTHQELCHAAGLCRLEYLRLEHSRLPRVTRPPIYVLALRPIPESTLLWGTGQQQQQPVPSALAAVDASQPTHLPPQAQPEQPLPEHEPEPPMSDHAPSPDAESPPPPPPLQPSGVPAEEPIQAAPLAAAAAAASAPSAAAVPSLPAPSPPAAAPRRSAKRASDMAPRISALAAAGTAADRHHASAEAKAPRVGTEGSPGARPIYTTHQRRQAQLDDTRTLLGVLRADASEPVARLSLGPGAANITGMVHVLAVAPYAVAVPEALRTVAELRQLLRAADALFRVACDRSELPQAVHTVLWLAEVTSALRWAGQKDRAHALEELTWRKFEALNEFHMHYSTLLLLRVVVLSRLLPYATALRPIGTGPHIPDESTTLAALRQAVQSVREHTRLLERLRLPQGDVEPILQAALRRVQARTGWAASELAEPQRAAEGILTRGPRGDG